MKPPLKPLFITVSEAVRLSGVSRGRLWEWMDAGLLPFRYNGARRLIKFTDLEATLDSLPRGSAPAAGPLLPEQDQALARERANPDFARIFTERFENLVPRLGEDEARRQALAHGVRAYRSYHDCAYKPARAALLALIKLNPPSAQLQTELDRTRYCRWKTRSAPSSSRASFPSTSSNPPRSWRAALP